MINFEIFPLFVNKLVDCKKTRACIDLFFQGVPLAGVVIPGLDVGRPV